MQKSMIVLLGGILFTACTHVQNPSDAVQQLQTGDLLFCLETQEEGLGGAIAAVTEGVGQQRITHVAIVVDSSKVVEATTRFGVRTLSVEQFLRESHHAADGSPLVVLGRLRDTTGVAYSVRRALQYVGLPYDTLYLPDASAIYCSELVQLSYTRPDGTAIFSPIPMTFRDASGNIPDYWTRLYQAHGMEVPEGWPGSNPGALSRDTALCILPLPCMAL